MAKQILTVPPDISGKQLADELALQTGSRVLFLMSGADLAEFHAPDAIQRSLDALAKVVAEKKVVAVDGGTSSGPMGMFDRSLGEIGFEGKYLGFLPEGKAIRRGKVDAKVLGENHSHIVLVTGEEFGDERPAMFSLIYHLGNYASTLGVLVNGGQRALMEVESAVALGKPVVVFKGSGRLADQLAMAMETPRRISSHEIQILARHGHFAVFDVEDKPAKLRKLVAKYLK